MLSIVIVFGLDKILYPQVGNMRKRKLSSNFPLCFLQCRISLQVGVKPRYVQGIVKHA